ncbi:MFS transporter [Telmatospirillum sp. J64-1]|uniref:MFS transporter n=1 Tax=Telmatospirillum sp. J64-1 TaxID=2502183 RepID=UPI00115D5C85|nr:MFS transporter [Telmatospirillum sp. J64-1]
MSSAASDPAILRRDTIIMGLVGLAHFCSHFFQLSFAPMIPLLREDFGVSYVVLGSVITTFYFTSGIAQAFAGILVDRWGARPLMIAGVAIMASCIALAGLVTELWMLYPLMILAGLGNSVFHPADLSLLSSRISPIRLGRAYSVHALSGTLGYAMAPIVVGALAYYGGWRFALISAGLLGWLAVLLLLRYGRHLKDEAVPAGERQTSEVKHFSYGRLLRTPAIVLAFAYFILTGMSGTGFQTFSTSSLVEFYDITVKTATFALTAFLVCSAVGILLGGIIADKTTRHARVAAFGLAAAGASMAVIATGMLPYALVLVVVGIAGLCQGMTAPSRDILVKSATPPGSAGKVFGFVYSGLDAGSTLSPLIFAAILDHGSYQLFFAAMAAIFTMMIFSVLSVAKPKRAVQSSQVS